MDEWSNSMKKRKNVWQQYIGTAFYLLIGVICGLLMVQYTDLVFSAEGSFWTILLSLFGLFVIMYIAIFVQMIIHEAGHLVFGLLSGYHFSSFRIMSFMWVRENGKPRFRRLTIAGTGGQCLMSPPELVDGRIPVILYNLGGSFMNILTGFIFLFLHFAFGAVPFLSAAFLMSAMIGFVFAVMNGFPMRMGAVDNDGYNALSLTRSNEAMRSFWVQMKINEQITKGLRLKDMPDAWFSVPADSDMQNSMTATMGVFACNRLMDQHRFEEADKLMAHQLEIESGMVGLHRNLMICDRIYYELITRNRREVIDEMLSKQQKKFMKSMKNFPSVLRTVYAYNLLAERNSEKAASVKEQFEKYAKSYPYPHEIQAERELMEIAEAKISQPDIT